MKLAEVGDDNQDYNDFIFFHLESAVKQPGRGPGTPAHDYDHLEDHDFMIFVIAAMKVSRFH